MPPHVIITIEAANTSFRGDIDASCVYDDEYENGDAFGAA